MNAGLGLSRISPVPAWVWFEFSGFCMILSDRFQRTGSKNISGRIIPGGYLRYDIAGVNTNSNARFMEVNCMD